MRRYRSRIWSTEHAWRVYRNRREAIRARNEAVYHSSSDSDDVPNIQDSSSHSSDTEPESPQRWRRRLNLTTSRPTPYDRPVISISTDDDDAENQANDDASSHSVGPQESDDNTESGVVLPDKNLLDCPVCVNPLTAQVYQCESGHCLCSTCNNKLEKCPSCKKILEGKRCIAIEKILESITVPCPNMIHGCPANPSYSGQLEHGKSCKFTQCSCPHDDCNFIAKSNLLYQHFSVQHYNHMRQFHVNVTTQIRLRKDSNRVILQDGFGSELFVLNRTVVPMGSIISIICLGPKTSVGHTYRIDVQARGQRLSLVSSVETAPKCETQPPEHNYLVIPSYFADHLETLDLALLVEPM